jgi:small-conductance mechanosensitive channel/CRP-like cAMP-binding protein
VDSISRALLDDPFVLRAGLAFVVGALVLALFVRRERRHLARLGLLFGLSLALRCAREAAAGGEMPSVARTLGFLALVLQGFAFLGLAAVVVFAVLLRAVRVDTPRILRDLTVAAAYLVYVFYAFSVHNVDVTGIVATSAVVTAVIGFSLQEVLQNVMGGVALQLDASIAPGDWVRFGDIAGRIREITWRHTAIETRNGDTYVVPNSLLMRNPVMVQGRRVDDPETRERRLVTFNVDYRFTPSAVIDAVVDALTREPIPNVAATPPPACILLDFKESWAVYQTRYWLLDVALDDPTDSVVRARIAYALKRAGIPLSIPAQSVFLTSEDAERAAHVRSKEQAARTAALASVSLFATLTSDERASLAERLSPAVFAPAEAIVVQGSEVHHLYILVKGEVEVRVSVEGAPARTVARLTAPDFFGEMGMLTGEPRKATVVALTEVTCWLVEKEPFRAILSARPQIADDISRILAARDVELAAVREGLSEEAKALRLAHEHRSLLERIRHFFSLEE